MAVEPHFSATITHYEFSLILARLAALVGNNNKKTYLIQKFYLNVYLNV